MRPANGRRVRVYGQHSQLSRCHVTLSHTSRDITGAVMTSVMSLHQRSLDDGMVLQRTNDFSNKEWAEKRAC